MNDSEQQRKVQSCAARIVTGFFFDIIVNKKKCPLFIKKKFETQWKGKYKIFCYELETVEYISTLH